MAHNNHDNSLSDQHVVTSIMKKFRSLTIWTVVLNFFILIGAGHGLASIGLIEVWGIFNKFQFNAEYFSFSLTASYEDSFGPVAILFLAGQIFILLSLLLKKNSAIIWTRIVGLGFLWIGFYYLTHNFFNSADGGLSQLSFYTGIPFLIASFRLVYKTLRRDRVNIPEDLPHRFIPVDTPSIRAFTRKHQASPGEVKDRKFQNRPKRTGLFPNSFDNGGDKETRTRKNKKNSA